MHYHYYKSAAAAWDAWGYLLMSGRAYLEDLPEGRSKVNHVQVNHDGYLEYRSDVINHPAAAILAHAPEGFTEF